jgi:hypothetical protein
MNVEVQNQSNPSPLNLKGDEGRFTATRPVSFSVRWLRQLLKPKNVTE